MRSARTRKKNNAQSFLSLVNPSSRQDDLHRSGEIHEKITKETNRSIEGAVDRQRGEFSVDLWLCIYFPKLAVEIEAEHQYRVIYQETKGQCIVHRASQLASECGVKSGMSLDAARVLCPEIEAVVRDVSRENEIIQGVADWVYTYSSDLSIINNDLIILEVGASDKLYKSIESLSQEMSKILDEGWNLSHSMAITPTPLASMMLARHKQSRDDLMIITKKEKLRSVLGGLPVSVLVSEEHSSNHKDAFSVNNIKSLRNMGIETLSGLWRLPTKELLQRFGKASIEMIERLLGKQVDLQKLYKAPVNFNTSMELPLEVKTNKLVLQALSKLISRLVIYLKRKDAGTCNLKIKLTHCRLEPTTIEILLRQFTRDGHQMSTLIEERFGRVTLEAPVIEVSLEADHIEVYDTGSNDLFEYDSAYTNNKNRKKSWNDLLSRLSARLGEGNVKNLELQADHRPECAWRYTYNKHKNNNKNLNEKPYGTLLRPAWLFPLPYKLSMNQSRLYYQSAIELLHGPERIENGWWDDNDVRRDYYIARDNSGSRLWVFCDLKKKGHWYIHGLFA